MGLTRVRRQDWSTGAARPGGSPWAEPTAVVPHWNKPPARSAPATTSLLSDGGDLGDAWAGGWAGAEGNVTR